MLLSRAVGLLTLSLLCLFALFIAGVLVYRRVAYSLRLPKGLQAHFFIAFDPSGPGEGRCELMREWMRPRGLVMFANDDLGVMWRRGVDEGGPAASGASQPQGEARSHAVVAVASEDALSAKDAGDCVLRGIRESAVFVLFVTGPETMRCASQMGMLAQAEQLGKPMVLLHQAGLDLADLDLSLAGPVPEPAAAAALRRLLGSHSLQVPFSYLSVSVDRNDNATVIQLEMAYHYRARLRGSPDALPAASVNGVPSSAAQTALAARTSASFVDDDLRSFGSASDEAPEAFEADAESAPSDHAPRYAA